MTREVHVRFCEGVGVKFPRATRPLIHTFSGEILLPHIVVIPPEFDIKISRIFVVLNVSTAGWDQSKESILS